MSGLLAGCATSKKAPEIKSPPPPELTDYAPKKEGEWFNVADIFSYKENPFVVLKKYKEWIGRQYFNLISQKNRASFALPANTVLNAYEERDGRNPAFFYRCAERKFFLSFGSAIDSIAGKDENTSYFIYRVNGKYQWSDQQWQPNDAPRQVEGIDTLSAEIKGIPKGLPQAYPNRKFTYLEEIDAKNPLSKVLTARTFEMSAIPNKDDETGGVYARWDFSKTLKELKESGDLDRACQMMLGSDYISIPPAKAKTLVPETKKGDEKQEKKQ